MTRPFIFQDVDWYDPDSLLGPRVRDCATLEVVAEAAPVFTRAQLSELGVDGIEFGDASTEHRARMATDFIRLTAGSTSTRPGVLYRVDGHGYYVEADVRFDLPFGDGSVDWIYSEHLLEHIPLPAATNWLTEVRRILAPGGMLRVSTPDLAKYMRGYVSDDGFFTEHHDRVNSVVDEKTPFPGRPAFLVNQIFYHYGHKWIYDEAELRHVLGEAGFADADVHRRSYREGMREDLAVLDKVWRNDESLYIEAVRG